MNLFEIDTKYFRFGDGAVELLESYKNPSAELEISFDQIDKDMGKYYYRGTVIETSSNDVLLRIDFSIFEASPNAVIIDNIRPNSYKVDSNKIVHTSAGEQNTGIDMGHTAMKWVFNKIKEFATSLGFSIKQIKSSTRYTGARAKNNPSAGDAANFDVSVNVRESKGRGRGAIAETIYSYSCSTGELSVYIPE